MPDAVSSAFQAESHFNPHKLLLKWILFHLPHCVNEKLKLREVKLPKVSQVGSGGLVPRKGDLGLGLQSLSGTELGSLQGRCQCAHFKGGNIEAQRGHIARGPKCQRWTCTWANLNPGPLSLAVSPPDPTSSVAWRPLRRPAAQTCVTVTTAPAAGRPASTTWI